jgi:DNA modification methylase
VSDPYEQLLLAKVTFDSACGYDIDDSEIHPLLLPHQRDIVRWAVHGGRRAIFASFGLGKSIMQLEVCRLTKARAGGRALIVCPLGVRQEFKRDAAMIGQTSKFVRWTSEVHESEAEPDIWLTNYESIRDGRLDPELFTVISLDEGAVLRSLGTKTFQTFRTLCDAVPHRFVATATPSPNEHTELTNYADFLGVLDRGQALTRWFKRNSTKAGELTLMEHRIDEFWAWVSTWSVWLQKPSDLGYSDDGYTLPEIDVRYHEIEVDALGSLTFENQGQGILVRDGALGVVGASKEKRDSITARVEKAKEIVDADPLDHFVLWHHLESERQVISRLIPDVCEVYGSLDLDVREERIVAFSEGEERLLATKPSLSGSGCNFQRHCHRAIFVGIDFKFADFIQACHRIQRFQQAHPVRIDIIHADTERQVVAELNRKWKQHREMVATMSQLIQEQGLSQKALTDSLARSIGTQRVAASGEGWEIVNDDTVRETRRMPSESVDLVWSSPPYGTQYEYVAAVEDFGHNDDNDAFWRQMDYLTPELHRILKPGRMCIFHTKDRIRFGNMNGRGYATVQPFAAEAIMHMIKHGFGFVGEITLDTDVVRENNQTYRLGWSEVVKDRTRIGVGTPEKVLLFRKNQTDRTTGAADDPVVKTKDEYTLARWQIDAAAFWKSSGDRFITPEELEGLPVPMIRKVFAAACESRIYDYEAHVALGDDFAGRGRLPTTFAMLAPTTESPVIWTEVNRLRSLNTSQAQKGRELHVCPTPTDVLDRCINQWSNPGDLIYDPFGGLGSCVVRALALGRRGKCTELNPLYWGDAVKYAQAMEYKVNMPSLFDLLDEAAEAAVA